MQGETARVHQRGEIDPSLAQHRLDLLNLALALRSGFLLWVFFFGRRQLIKVEPTALRFIDIVLEIAEMLIRNLARPRAYEGTWVVRVCLVEPHEGLAVGVLAIPGEPVQVSQGVPFSPLLGNQLIPLLLFALDSLLLGGWYLLLLAFLLRVLGRGSPLLVCKIHNGQAYSWQPLARPFPPR